MKKLKAAGRRTPITIFVEGDIFTKLSLLIWAVVACFSCYFGGIFLAILINSKGIRFKKMWRAIFIFAMAIPAFVSLLVINTMLGQYGIINVLLQNWGFTTETLPFLTNATWARGTVIVVNLWLGILSTMLMVSGILMNIPPDLYESASIDGAPHFTIFYKLMIPMAKPIIIYQLMTASAVLR